MCQVLSLHGDSVQELSELYPRSYPSYHGCLQVWITMERRRKKRDERKKWRRKMRMRVVRVMMMKMVTMTMRTMR
uniref:Uncharacterized protein n=1 Tax=Anguilla anguilla TaxID=7936 RepID=A0A0E9WDQ6_ANGAN